MIYSVSCFQDMLTQQNPENCRPTFRTCHVKVGAAWARDYILPNSALLAHVLMFMQASFHAESNDIKGVSDIASIIKRRSVRAKFLFSFMIGLPNSGITSLLLKLINRKQKLAGANGLDQYETVIFKDSVTGKSYLKDITDAEEKDDAMILYSLAKFLVIKHYKILLSEEDLRKQLVRASGEFENAEVDSHFRDVCSKLFKTMNAINLSDGLQVSISRSHSFMSFF